MLSHSSKRNSRIERKLAVLRPSQQPDKPKFYHRKSSCVKKIRAGRNLLVYLIFLSFKQRLKFPSGDCLELSINLAGIVILSQMRIKAPGRVDRGSHLTQHQKYSVYLSMCRRCCKVSSLFHVLLLFAYLFHRFFTQVMFWQVLLIRRCNGL